MHVINFACETVKCLELQSPPWQKLLHFILPSDIYACVATLFWVCPCEPRLCWKCDPFCACAWLRKHFHFNGSRRVYFDVFACSITLRLRGWQKLSLWRSGRGHNTHLCCACVLNSDARAEWWACAGRCVWARYGRGKSSTPFLLINTVH